MKPSRRQFLLGLGGLLGGLLGLSRCAKDEKAPAPVPRPAEPKAPDPLNAPATYDYDDYLRTGNLHAGRVATYTFDAGTGLPADGLHYTTTYVYDSTAKRLA